MSPRLRRNWGGSRGTLRTLVYLATYCAFERIDELACVAALLAILLLENSSPVHPASFQQPEARAVPGFFFERPADCNKLCNKPEDECARGDRAPVIRGVGSTVGCGVDGFGGAASRKVLSAGGRGEGLCR